MKARELLRDLSSFSETELEYEIKIYADHGQNPENPYYCDLAYLDEEDNSLRDVDDLDEGEDPKSFKLVIVVGN